MRWDAVSRKLPGQMGNVLEVGSGKGGFAARIAPRCQQFTGLEPDPTSHAIAVDAIGADADISLSRVEDLAASETFDLVCAFEVLEHLEDDAAALAQWAKKLRPGGMLMLSTPAHANRLGAWDRMVGHHRRYDVETMQALLASAGLKDIEIELYGHPIGQVLERVRNLIAARRLKNSENQLGDYVERTSSSARLLQPSGALASLGMRFAAVPLAAIQRLFPNQGIALIATARRPQ